MELSHLLLECQRKKYKQEGFISIYKNQITTLNFVIRKKNPCPQL